MESIECQRMFDLEDQPWWFQGRIDLMRRMVLRHCPSVPNRNPDLLDLGCGTGLFVEEQGRNKTTFGLDLLPEALMFSGTHGVSKLICADSQMLPFASGSFDIVTAFDLIQHVDWDEALIAEAYRVLRPGCGVIMLEKFCRS